MSARALNVVIRLPSGGYDDVQREARTAGAVVFRDAPTDKAGAHLGVRSTPRHRARTERVLLGTEWWSEGACEKEVRELTAAGSQVWVEVTSASQARKAISAGAEGLVVCAGRGSAQLVRRIVTSSPEWVRVIASATPDMAADCIAAGACGVALEGRAVAGTLTAVIEGLTPPTQHDRGLLSSGALGWARGRVEAAAELRHRTVGRLVDGLRGLVTRRHDAADVDDERPFLAPYQEVAQPLPAPVVEVSAEAVHRRVLAILAAHTGCEPEAVGPQVLLDAELGIDTVKWAEIMAEVHQHYGLAPDPELRLGELPTLPHLVAWVCRRLGVELPPEAAEKSQRPGRDALTAMLNGGVSVESLEKGLPASPARHSGGTRPRSADCGSPPRSLLPGFFAVGAVGLDEVGQRLRSIAAALEREGLAALESLTARVDVDECAVRVAITWNPSAGAEPLAALLAQAAEAAEAGDREALIRLDGVFFGERSAPCETAATDPPRDEAVDEGVARVQRAVLELLAARAGLPASQIHPEHEIADLGIDTVGQAQILTEVHELFGLGEGGAHVRLAEYVTPAALVEYVTSRLAQVREQTREALVAAGVWLTEADSQPFDLGVVRQALAGRTVLLLGSEPATVDAARRSLLWAGARVRLEAAEAEKPSELALLNGEPVHGLVLVAGAHEAEREHDVRRLVEAWAQAIEARTDADPFLVGLVPPGATLDATLFGQSLPGLVQRVVELPQQRLELSRALRLWTAVFRAREPANQSPPDELGAFLPGELVLAAPKPEPSLLFELADDDATREILPRRPGERGVVAFALLDRVPWIEEHSLVATGHEPRPRALSAVGLEAAALECALADGRVYLCEAVERCEVFGWPEADEAVVARVLERPLNDRDLRICDVEVLTEDALLLQRLYGLRLVPAGDFEGDAIPSPTPKRFALTRKLSVARAERLLESWGLTIEELVSPLENASYRRLRSEARRREWAAARVAMKLLVRDYLRDVHGLRAPLESIDIAKNVHGAPSLELGEVPPLVSSRLPAVSLSHSGGRALVGLARAQRHRLGVDVEIVEPRSSSFAGYFSADELALRVRDVHGDTASQAEQITALWCLKEATTKALGLGFHLALSEVQVVELDDDGRARIAVTGRARQRLEDLGGADIEAYVRVGAHYATAESLLATPGNVLPAPTPWRSKPTARTRKIAALAALLREKGVIASATRAKNGPNGNVREVAGAPGAALRGVG